MTTLNATIVADETRNTYETKRLAKELFAAGFDMVKVSSQTDFNRSFGYGESVILVRTGSGTTTETIRTCEFLAKHGVVVANSPSALRHGRDKLLQSRTLVNFGVPTPTTVAVDQSTTVENLSRILGTEFIIKYVAGTNGDGIFFHKEDDQARRCLNVNREAGMKLIAQRLIPGGTTDYRVLVCDGMALGAMRRSAVGGDRRANASRGARCEEYLLEPEMVRIALKAAAAMGMLVAGVDLVRDGGGWSVLEVNASPRFRYLDRCLRQPFGWRRNGSVSQHIAAAIREEARAAIPYFRERVSADLAAI